MELTKEMCKVAADIEEIIGSECYNPNSYDGWNDVEGCSFRYPVNVPNGKGSFVKVRSNVSTLVQTRDSEISPDTIKRMKYRFGSNELYIGRGIIHALKYLEDRYNLDFNSLEKKLRQEDSII